MSNNIKVNSTLVEHKSSTIKQIDYDPLFDKMIVIFKNSNYSYEYYNVPFSVYEELTSSESVGKYFHNNIKGKYEFAKRNHSTGY